MVLLRDFKVLLTWITRQVWVITIPPKMLMYLATSRGSLPQAMVLRRWNIFSIKDSFNSKPNKFLLSFSSVLALLAVITRSYHRLWGCGTDGGGTHLVSRLIISAFAVEMEQGSSSTLREHKLWEHKLYLFTRHWGPAGEWRRICVLDRAKATTWQIQKDGVGKHCCRL